MLVIMEKAIHIGLKKIGTVHDLGNYHRLYVGDEFCYLRMPDISSIKKLTQRIGSNNISILTPYLTQSNLDQFRHFLLDLHTIGDDFEIVFNDWGTFNLIRGNDFHFKLVAGRLINRQKRDPRLKEIIKRSVGDTANYLKNTAAGSSAMENFFKKNGVNRIELDNVFQGINKIEHLKASIYYPEVFISVSRKCMNDQFEYELKKSCHKECLERTHVLEKKQMGVPIYVRGNYQFYMNENLPKDLEKLNIDRVVYNFQE